MSVLWDVHLAEILKPVPSSEISTPFIIIGEDSSNTFNLFNLHTFDEFYHEWYNVVLTLFLNDGVNNYNNYDDSSKESQNW